MAMNMHWANEYIGTPYLRGGDGLGGFDCWTFFRHVQKEQFSRDIPFVNSDVYDGGIRAMRDAFEGDDALKVRTDWQQMPTDMDWADGSAVLMRQLKDPHHIGIWLNIDGGGVLHCVKNMGVVFSNRSNLRKDRWRIVEVYNHVE